MEIIRNSNYAKIECIKCNKLIHAMIQENAKMLGRIITCECGCIQRCIIEDGDNSGWRVINPFGLNK